MNKKHVSHFTRTVAVVLLLTTGAFAHPGPLGHHHHPDEVDEFDHLPKTSEVQDFNLGGAILIGCFIASLTLAFFQKEQTETSRWKEVSIPR
jgi:hypothetical protein